VLNHDPEERAVLNRYMLCIFLLLLAPACKPVPQESLMLLYTGDTLGQIEPCG
jgi:hypothetical protein